MSELSFQTQAHTAIGIHQQDILIKVMILQAVEAAENFRRGNSLRVSQPSRHTGGKKKAARQFVRFSQLIGPPARNLVRFEMRDVTETAFNFLAQSLLLYAIEPYAPNQQHQQHNQQGCF